MPISGTHSQEWEKGHWHMSQMLGRELATQIREQSAKNHCIGKWSWHKHAWTCCWNSQHGSLASGHITQTHTWWQDTVVCVSQKRCNPHTAACHQHVPTNKKRSSWMVLQGNANMQQHSKVAIQQHWLADTWQTKMTTFTAHAMRGWISILDCLEYSGVGRCIFYLYWLYIVAHWYAASTWVCRQRSNVESGWHK